MKLSKGEKVFSVFNYIFLALVAIVSIYPLYDVLRLSLSPTVDALNMQIRLFPSKITFEAYNYVMQNQFIWNGYSNTIVRIIFGLFISMTIMIGGAYALSKKDFPNRNFWTIIIVFTMFFNGGLVPSYLLVKNLHLDDTIWSLVLPRAVDTFGMLIMRNYFMSIPKDIEESANIDGAGTLRVLIQIILPLSMSIIMTVGMWILVWHWNSWFDCLIYIRTSKMYVLQAVLRKIIIESTAQFDSVGLSTIETIQKPNDEVVKCATIIVSTLPILCIYPFVQKYFVKGVMVGSLKG